MAETKGIVVEQKCNALISGCTLASGNVVISMPAERRPEVQKRSRAPWVLSLLPCLKRLMTLMKPNRVIKLATHVRKLEGCPLGYPRLAAFSASDQNFMLYRGFGYVHARLLLDLQAEVSTLEQELDDLDEMDNNDENMLRLQCREEDIESALEVGGRRTRRQVLDELSEKVSKYDDLLIKARELVSFQRPTERDYRSVQTWFHNIRPIVEGEERYIHCREDIVSLRHGREWGGFDGIIENLLRKLNCSLIRKIFCIRELREKTSDKHIYYFSPTRVEKLVGAIITTVIFVLLVLPVVALYRLTYFGSRRSIFSAIGVLVTFTLLFAAAMSLLTKARRHELFAASAAYCAVLVVFITNFGNPVAK